MTTHELKVWPEYFNAARKGEKPFEVRLNDRDYAVGDVLVLKEWNPWIGIGGEPFGYTGREIRRRVTYVLPGGQFGISPRWCVLGLAVNE